MILPYTRYFELYKKSQSVSYDDITPSLFSFQEIRDLQVWSNLVWIDPLFRSEKPVKSLFTKERNFTEEEKKSLLDWQIEHIKKIIPTYQNLYKDGKIDISFTPYYHPILPLLCDTDSAKEAMPNIPLPKQRFMHPEDADKQIKMSTEKFQKLFNTEMQGMWPSEGSVSENTLRLIADNKIKWVATDEEVLINSLKKSKMEIEKNHPYQIYSYNGVKIFFRDHILSDRIGFVYSGLPASQAVDDFLTHIYKIRERFKNNLDEIVIPVILDGENAWEYFENDGKDFLELLYSRLAEDELIEAIGMTEATQHKHIVELNSLFAGSWINHNFKIWIGHEEDNKAWDLLANTRTFLVQFEQENHNFDKNILQSAWDKIYKAEGSDWCWWYGDEHQGEHNHIFDSIFRNHLASVYQLLGQKVPPGLKVPIQVGRSKQEITLPEGLISPIIDGKQTHYYEWVEAGSYKVEDSGGAMHRISKSIKKLYFGFDHDNLYFRVSFNMEQFASIETNKLLINFLNLNNFNIEIPFGKCDTIDEKDFSYAFADELEIAIAREKVFPDGYGLVQFSVSLFEGENKIETIPEEKTIELDVPQKGQEMFWPM